jgi:hypothetical protein
VGPAGVLIHAPFLSRGVGGGALGKASPSGRRSLYCLHFWWRESFNTNCNILIFSARGLPWQPANGCQFKQRRWQHRKLRIEQCPWQLQQLESQHWRVPMITGNAQWVIGRAAAAVAIAAM